MSVESRSGAGAEIGVGARGGGGEMFEAGRAVVVAVIGAVVEGKAEGDGGRKREGGVGDEGRQGKGASVSGREEDLLKIEN